MCKASNRISQKGFLLGSIVYRFLFEGFSLITNISTSSSLKVCFWIKHLWLSTFELSFLLFPFEITRVITNPVTRVSCCPHSLYFFLISKSSYLLSSLFCLNIDLLHFHLSDTLHLAAGPFVTMTTTSYQQRISLLSARLAAWTDV